MLYIHLDMWGPFYLCDACGWTAEDDNHLDPAVATVGKLQMHVLTVGEAHRAWEARRHPR
jgi:hypothetical protein